MQASEPYERVLGRREMPGAQWFPGSRLSYAEHFFRDRDDDAVAIRHASELRELSQWTWGELREQTARIAAGLRRMDVGPGRPGGRLHAQHPRDDRGLPGHRLDRRGVVERRARVRRALGGRPLRADRAQGAPGGRRLPLRRARPRPRRGRRRHRRGDRRAGRALRLPRRRRLAGGARGPRRAADLRAGARSTTRSGCSSARARRACPSRSSTARAGSCSSTSSYMHLHLDAQEGDRVFWFTTTGWMMWNFLVGVLLTPASIVLYRRQPGLARPRRAVGPRARTPA